MEVNELEWTTTEHIVTAPDQRRMRIRIDQRVRIEYLDSLPLAATPLLEHETAPKPPAPTTPAESLSSLLPSAAAVAEASAVSLPLPTASNGQLSDGEQPPSLPPKALPPTTAKPPAIPPNPKTLPAKKRWTDHDDWLV